MIRTALLLGLAGCTEVYVSWEPVDEPIDTGTPELEDTGGSVVPRLSLEPEVLDLGAVWAGCTETGWITLRNAGTATLAVRDVIGFGEGFALGAVPELPSELAPGRAATVEVVFAPGEVGLEFEGTLLVDSDDPAGDRAARLVGEVAVPDGTPPPCGLP